MAPEVRAAILARLLINRARDAANLTLRAKRPRTGRQRVRKAAAAILLSLGIAAVDSVADPGMADPMPEPSLSCYNAGAIYLLSEDE